MTTSFSAPQTLLCDGARLLQIRASLDAGETTFSPALEQLRAQAEHALAQGPYSVMQKPMTPPSGDKHDYLSLSIYWWPDPDVPDGLPYIWRDGEINPTAHQSDKLPLEEMTAASHTLALAAFFTGEARYAERAALLLRTWFLDAETRANPHMLYGAVIPGRNTGRYSGIIDTSLQFPTIIETLALLQNNPAWTPEDQSGMKNWMGRYLDWIETHPYGAEEANEMNNHGIRYDVHIVCLALFVGREEIARRVLREVGPRRIALQIEPDGTLPHELKRTRGLIYSMASLEALFRLATMGERLGIDLWHFETEDGRSIRRAFEWITPYLSGEKAWDYQEITPPGPAFGANLIQQAFEVYGDPKYAAAVSKMPIPPQSRFHLRFVPTEDVH